MSDLQSGKVHLAPTFEVSAHDWPLIWETLWFDSIMLKGARSGANPLPHLTGNNRREDGAGVPYPLRVMPGIPRPPPGPAF